VAEARAVVWRRGQPRTTRRQHSATQLVATQCTILQHVAIRRSDGRAPRCIPCMRWCGRRWAGPLGAIRRCRSSRPGTLLRVSSPLIARNASPYCEKCVPLLREMRTLIARNADPYREKCGPLSREMRALCASENRPCSRAHVQNARRHAHAPHACARTAHADAFAWRTDVRAARHCYV
jgi:hypothetical protein